MFLTVFIEAIRVILAVLVGALPDKWQPCFGAAPAQYHARHFDEALQP